MKLNGAEIILECLLEQDVNTVFGYPGGAVLYIYDALYKYSDKIKHIITAHEQGACHAADGFSRSTGKTGVVIATSGPGATNLVTGLATAHMDSIPLVAITGNVASHLLGLDSFQEVDITGITMPITKHNYVVRDVNELADTIREAFYIANSGRKGPVLIDIPKDITAQLAEYEKKAVKEVVNHNPPEITQQIEDAVEIIKNSERPFIYAGGGVVSCNAFEELKTFVHKIDSPISLSLMGRGGFDNTDPYQIGMLGMHGTVTSSRALRDCDVMIVLGSRFSDRVSCNPEFGRGIKIIHVEIDPAEVNKNIKVGNHVIGDLKYVLTKFNEMLPDVKHDEWMAQIFKWKEKYPLRQVSDNEEEVLPQYVLRTLAELTDNSAILTTEVGQHQMWAAQYYDFKKPRAFATSGGLGTMGYGLGASMGAKVGNPDRVVVNVAGDGSCFMNLNEFSTLSQFNIPVIELIFNNEVLGMVRQWQRLFYEKRFSQTNINRGTDFLKLADAFGINGFRITKKSEVRDTLKKAIELNKPVIIDCRIDKDINVLPMVPAGASVYEPITEIEIDD